MIFSFKGVNKYLEEFVARIDAPQLYRLSITFFSAYQLQTPELNQFISRTPTLRGYDEARLMFLTHGVQFRLRPFQPRPSNRRKVEVKFLCQVPDREVSTLARICTLSLPLHLLLTMEDLYIDGTLSSPLIFSEDEIENTEWLDLLRPFTAVKNLYLSQRISPRIALALEELTGGRTTEVLPALQNVLLEGFRPSEPVQKGIEQFISARQFINHPVAISDWRRPLTIF
jgi:hypothetical protein